MNKIKLLRDEQKQSFLNEMRNAENRAVSNIKSDNKYFFKYANRHRKVLASPSVLVDQNHNLVTDPVSIADQLQNQFKSVFSGQDHNLNPHQNMKPPKILYPLPDLFITRNDVQKAIGEIRTEAACPSEEIPARVLKECKETLSFPLQYFFNKSFKTGIVPSSYKLQQIVPIFKKGSKTEASNYRPVSLTPHTIKVFERILRIKLVGYFESNQLLNCNQHGF